LYVDLYSFGIMPKRHHRNLHGLLEDRCQLWLPTYNWRMIKFILNIYSVSFSQFSEFWWMYTVA
jgi:hypothetical protein